ncbi:MAG: peptidase S8/S53 subtilisin kexin sedolisin, partial [Actinomycetota bacterium]|nr:peptidase S8/S53 subtilisin kexin sedolisin [Actinomycetota bacterium]
MDPPPQSPPRSTGAPPPGSTQAAPWRPEWLRFATDLSGGGRGRWVVAAAGVGAAIVVIAVVAVALLRAPRGPAP